MVDFELIFHVTEAIIIAIHHDQKGIDFYEYFHKCRYFAAGGMFP